MRIMLDKGAYPPVREHVTDAGMDMRAYQSGIVKAGQSAVFHTIPEWARIIGVNRKTIYRWVKKYGPEQAILKLMEVAK